MGKNKIKHSEHIFVKDFIRMGFRTMIKTQIESINIPKALQSFPLHGFKISLSDISQF